MRKEAKKEILWNQLSISILEADIAYFEARLALLDGEPKSYYQTAQTRAYRELERVLNIMLNRLQCKKSKISSSSEK